MLSGFSLYYIIDSLEIFKWNLEKATIDFIKWWSLWKWVRAMLYLVTRYYLLPVIYLFNWILWQWWCEVESLQGSYHFHLSVVVAVGGQYHVTASYYQVLCLDHPLPLLPITVARDKLTSQHHTIQHPANCQVTKVESVNFMIYPLKNSGGSECGIRDIMKNTKYILSILVNCISDYTNPWWMLCFHPNRICCHVTFYHCHPAILRY